MMKINDFNEDIYYTLSKYYKNLACNNLDNIIILESTIDKNNLYFQYIFIYYNTSIIDFTFYHFILKLNEMHFNIKYKSILLIIINININNSLFSLVFTIIDIENNDN